MCSMPWSIKNHERHTDLGSMPPFSPFSVQTTNKKKLAEDGKESTTNQRMLMENGHPGVEVDEAAIRRGENPYTKYYQQQGEQPLPVNAQVTDFNLQGSAEPY